MIDINKDLTLYHGSRGGIDGVIKPISRVRCDFGQGFYLGENPNQAKGLVIDDSSPYFYKIKLNLSQISDEKILVLSGRDWLNMILSNRKSVHEFNELQIARDFLEKTKKYDVIIGPIADDRMNEAIKRFEQRALTDKGLIACLQGADMGNQYVLKTDFACSKAQILEEKQIYGQDEQYIKEYVNTERKKVYSIVDDMQEKYQRDGLYLNEIIKEEKQKETSMSKQMSAKWHEFVALPREEKTDGIEWKGKRYRLPVFDDMYLAQCQKEFVTPDKDIKAHFLKCVDIQEYTPKYSMTANLTKNQDKTI